MNTDKKGIIWGYHSLHVPCCCYFDILGYKTTMAFTIFLKVSTAVEVFNFIDSWIRFITKNWKIQEWFRRVIKQNENLKEKIQSRHTKANKTRYSQKLQTFYDYKLFRNSKTKTVSKTKKSTPLQSTAYVMQCLQYGIWDKPRYKPIEQCLQGL